ncbi:hypothetical protein TrLO_g1514 [Triparma laevis f. longispina]|uniref:Glutamine synthetase type III N-terminal domain-containing protein n=1 Tax=Triparma laevis f. longispina TaxID=1714387 RepID=A0A9W7ALB3_9STRA|nr:hypothetical protein TrLO_g1514 [Triparma laevis f. longispina]
MVFNAASALTVDPRVRSLTHTLLLPAYFQHGASAALLTDPTWTEHISGTVAAAILDWAIDNGADSYCHWFQPMAASGFDFKGKNLIRGETDGFSFSNGGLHATHTAGGYLALDTSSPVFLRGGIVHIPSALVFFYGTALDEKTPLLRRSSSSPLEQYLRRMDLQMTRKTIMGKDAPRGQEICDHYTTAMSTAQPALEAQQECWKMGIPLKTYHREVALDSISSPPSSELTPHRSTRTSWSCRSSRSSSLNIESHCGQLKASGNDNAFAVIMSAIISAIDTHGDLVRMSIATPGNDFRLGACEAPPAITSTYLGDDMTSYIEAFKDGKSGDNPGTKNMQMGIRYVRPIAIPAEDRNRTSPFLYGGARFRYHAVGSVQNTSMVNTVLNTMTAQKFKQFADAIEGGAGPLKVTQDALLDSWKVIFNSASYVMQGVELI